jgi:hypothetical protein
VLEAASGRVPVHDEWWTLQNMKKLPIKKGHLVDAVSPSISGTSFRLACEPCADPRIAETHPDSQKPYAKSLATMVKSGLTKHGTAFLAYVFISLAAPASAAEALNYTLQGSLQVEYPDLGLGTSRYSFKVDVQDPNWVISSKPLNRSTEAASEWIVAHFDDRVFGLTRLADAALPQMSRTSRVENVAFAEVHGGWQPAAVSSLISRIAFVWFGCAPHNDLADGKVLLKPVWETPEGPDHELVTAFVKTHVPEPHLPAYAAFVTPNRYGSRDVSNFLYRVTVWTNVAGFEFPAEFLGQRYAQKKSGLSLRASYKGAVTSVIVQPTRALVLPDLPNPTVVTDFSRTTKANAYFEYTSTDGKYRNLTDGGEPLYPKIQLKAAVEQPGTRAARAVIIGFVVCTTIALIVIAVKRLRIRQKG